jgi:hypothetical protein
LNIHYSHQQRSASWSFQPTAFGSCGPATAPFFAQACGPQGWTSLREPSQWFQLMQAQQNLYQGWQQFCGCPQPLPCGQQQVSDPRQHVPCFPQFGGFFPSHSCFPRFGCFPSSGGGPAEIHIHHHFHSGPFPTRHCQPAPTPRPVPESCRPSRPTSPVPVPAPAPRPPSQVPLVRMLPPSLPAPPRVFTRPLPSIPPAPQNDNRGVRAAGAFGAMGVDRVFNALASNTSPDGRSVLMERPRVSPTTHLTSLTVTGRYV